MLRRGLMAGLALPMGASAQTVSGQAALLGPFTRLNTMLQPTLAQYNLPSAAAAVVRKGALIAAGAVGTRRVGSDSPVTLEDRFHIGSDTKAMTSLLAAMLVEQGKLRWDSTVGGVLRR